MVIFNIYTYVILYTLKYINYFVPYTYMYILIRDMNKSEFEQNEKLQEIVDQFNVKLKEKDENITEVSHWRQ